MTEEEMKKRIMEMRENEKEMTKKINKYESILASITEGGYDDLSILTDIDEKELDETLNHLKENGIWPSLSEIMYDLGRKAQTYLDDALTEYKVNATKEEYEKIEDLNPYEDFNIAFNYLATRTYLKNKELYEKCIPDAIKKIEDMIGMDVEE